MASNPTSTWSVPEKFGAIPWGVRVLRFMRIRSPFSRLLTYRIAILLLTYAFYVNYHSARRPMAVVKSVLRQSCVNMTPPEQLTAKEFRNGTWCQWAPFNKNSQTLFSGIDFVFRFSYAMGMLIAGYIAERTDLRHFITFGMSCAGFFAIFTGMAYFWEVHAYSFFIIANLLAGLFQGTGWPSVVALMGNWFGRHRRGFMFGIWNSHTSVGNILGAVLAGVWVRSQWGYSFIVPGLLLIACAILAFLFVVPHPNDIAMPAIDNAEDSTDIMMNRSESTVITSGEVNGSIDPGPDAYHEIDRKPISLWHACLIPGVVEFSCCLFFSKAVYYTFFFWLPVYIKVNSHVDTSKAADLSAVFDAGGIIGGILAGAVADLTGGSATVCGFMFLLAIPSLYCMVQYVAQGMEVLLGLLVITGLFINGPYALITTAVSTDLGTRPSLIKNQKSLATVAAVIDGMGSLGSAVGPLGAGLLADVGWDAVFYYLIAAQVAALLCLTRLIYREVRHWMLLWSRKRTQHMTVTPSEVILTLPEIDSNPDMAYEMSNNIDVGIGNDYTGPRRSFRI